MRITAYSVMMAWIWTSILAGALCIVLKNKRSLHYFSVKNFLLLYILCMIRLAVAIELPVTIIIPVKGVYNVMTRFCTKLLIGGVMPAGYGLLVIWLCGVAVKLYMVTRDYIVSRRMLRGFILQRDGLAKQLLEDLQRERGDKRIILVYETPLAVPMAMGIFYPAILLPAQEYTKLELYYIMKHEYTHILNHDTAVKLFLNLWSCVFWWNPFTYLIYKNMEHVMEINCDLAAVEEFDQNKKAEYLSTIVRIMQNTDKSNRKKRFSQNINTLFRQHHSSEMIKRFYSVSESEDLTKKKEKTDQRCLRILACIYLMVFCSSYAIVFQSSFDIPEKEKTKALDDYYIDSEYMYLRQIGEGYELLSDEGKILDLDRETGRILIEELGFEIK